MHTDDIRNAGLKVTVPRVKILQMLESSPDRHLGAEDIYKQLLAKGEDIGLATVYRVLTQFEAAGLIRRHHFEGGHAVYELNEGGHHDHIVCVRCGRVDEFVSPEIERLQKEVAARAGYQMRDHVLYIYGLCASCREEDSGSG